MGSRWQVRVIVAVMAALTASLVGPAAHESSGTTEAPHLVVVAPPLVTAGAPTWMTVYWLTWVDVCDVRVTVSGR